MTDPLERLTSIFERFPGIGPRQAQRFVQFLLRSSPSIRRELVGAIQEMAGAVHQCTECFRFHAGAKGPCHICANSERDQSLLAVVANDADLMAVERSGTYRGRYFVLGGTISLASEKTNGLRIKELKKAASRSSIEEIVLAFPANPEGDVTAVRVREELALSGVKVSSLGRGLSTGSELEYADSETLKSAIDNRK